MGSPAGMAQRPATLYPNKLLSSSVNAFGLITLSTLLLTVTVLPIKLGSSAISQGRGLRDTAVAMITGLSWNSFKLLIQVQIELLSPDTTNLRTVPVTWTRVSSIIRRSGIHD